MATKPDEERDGVGLTHLDQPLFDGAEVGGHAGTKRDLVDYLDAVSARIIPALRDRPLSVIRLLRGRERFMQKNLPKGAPAWIRTVSFHAERSHRDVAYALVDDRPTLLWFANQRAVEYHVPLTRADTPERPDALVIDLDPPEGSSFAVVVAVAHLVRRALDDAGLAGAVKTSGAKGVHVVVPLAPGATHEDAAAATRALGARTERLDPEIATTAFIKDDREGKVFVDSTRAGGATVVSVYSPRVRPGLPVSFPVAWDDLDDVAPSDFTVHTVPALVRDADPWTAIRPEPQELPAELVAEGHTIPIARVAAMHEGRRRKRT